MMTRRYTRVFSYQMMLPVIFVLYMYIGVSVCGEVIPYCIRGLNSQSQMNISCPDRIEVLFVYYGQLTSQPPHCQRPNSYTVTCSHSVTHGKELLAQTVFKFCSGLRQGCSSDIGPLPISSTCLSFNYFYMEYSCVPAAKIVNLCGDMENVTVTSPTHLAYFPSPLHDPTQNCTCVIRGAHRLTAVWAEIPQTTKEDNCIVSLTIHWIGNSSDMSRQVTLNTPLINQTITNTSVDISWIHYTRDCSTLTPPAWFKVQPAEEGPPPTISCSSMNNHSGVTANTTRMSTATATSATSMPGIGNVTSMTVTSTPIYNGATKNSMNEVNSDADKLKQVAVITSSVIGGLVLVAMVMVLVCVIYRRSNSRKDHGPGNGVVSPGSETGRFQDPQGRHVYHNDAFTADAAADSEYDHIAKVSTQQNDHNDTNANLYNRVTSNDLDYDHVQSVPSTEPSSDANAQTMDDTYHRLYEGRDEFKPRTLDPAADNRVRESCTDQDLNLSEPNNEGVYSEISDRPQNDHDLTGDKLHVADDPPRRKFPNPQTSVPVSFLYSTSVDKSPKPSPVYHVLEKEDFRTSSEDNDQGGILMNSAEENGDEETPSKMSDLDDGGAESETRGPGEQVEFVDNDLYQSAEFVDNDLHQSVEFVDNDLYQSADFPDQSTVLVDNDLYQSADNV